MRLHAQIMSAVEALADYLAWCGQQIRAGLPAPLRELGWRVDADIARPDPELGRDGGVHIEAQRHVSLLGETRLVSADGKPQASRLVIGWPRERQYRKTIRVGRAAARRGRAALDLRRDEFIPVPPGEAVYGYHVTGEADEITLGVDTAVARQREIDAFADIARSRSARWEIVGELTPAGATRFRFAHGASLLPGGALLRGTLVYVALLFALLAWSERGHRLEDALVAEQAAAVHSARALRDARDRFDLLTVRSDTADPTVRLGAILNALRQTADTVDDADAIERIRLRADGLQVQVSQADADGTVSTEQRVVALDGAQ